jgi:hypothetical protein
MEGLQGCGSGPDLLILRWFLLVNLKCDSLTPTYWKDQQVVNLIVLLLPAMYPYLSSSSWPAGCAPEHLTLLPAVYPYLSSSSPARSLVCRLPRLACRLCT